MNRGVSRASQVLACPNCHEGLTIRQAECLCLRCGAKLDVKDDVLLVDGFATPSFFDDKFEVMQQGHARHGGEFVLCYEQQLEYVEAFLNRPMVIADVGCGPGIEYGHHPECEVIGVEPSFVSIRANRRVSLRVCGLAARMPIRSASLDAVLCFYSLHHMVGRDVAETRANVGAAFSEFARVLKPDGHLFIAEMNPGPCFAFLQQHGWNLARRLLTTHLDQFFLTRAELAALASTLLPDAALTRRTPRTSPFTMLPPIFALRRFKLPRFLFPTSPTLFHWRRGAAPAIVDRGPACHTDLAEQRRSA